MRLVLPFHVAIALDLFSDRLGKLHDAHASAFQAGLKQQRRAACARQRRTAASMCRQLKGATSAPLSRLRDPGKPEGAIATHPQRLDKIVIATMGKIYQGNVTEQRQPHMLPTFMRKYHEHIKAQPPHPIDDITPAQLKALIKAMPDNTPGLDGIAKADLLLLSDEALDWLALFFQELERGMAWPTCSNIARTAFLSKGQDDLDPKGY